MTSDRDRFSQRRRFALKLAAALAAAPLAGRALAAFAERPVRLIVPGGAGGSSDAVARLPQRAAQQALGQPIVVENRTGAGGAVGTMDVLRSAPDGYTILMTSLGTHVLRPLIVKEGFDTLRDLAPITRLVDVPGVILAAPELPVGNLRELVAYAKAAPQPLAYGTPGIGTTPHLIAEFLAARTGIRLLHIPYAASSASYTDLMAGRLPLAFSLVTGVQGHIMGGRMKAIAVTSRQRLAALPNVPTVEESGLSDFDVTSWYGTMAPAGTPLAIREQLHAAFAAALRDPEVVERLAGIGAEVVAKGPTQFAEDLRADFRRWTPVIRDANIKI